MPEGRLPAHTDVLIIGAGAAGLMCAATAGYRGRRVLVLDHAPKPGRKILMSGGGRCNFTNLNSTPENFLSANPRFCISILRRYTPQNFLELVERHGVEWVEKAPGQLFCATGAADILNVLLAECEYADAQVRLRASVGSVRRLENGDNATAARGFEVDTSLGAVRCESLVIATGGLSIPTMGASPFAYDVARQFGLEVLPLRAGLVPFTLQPADKVHLEPLSGVSCDVTVRCGKQAFHEPLLITHRGLSGPAMLQISSFWTPGDALEIDWLPGVGDKLEWLVEARRQKPVQLPEHLLAVQLPQRLAKALCAWQNWTSPMQHFSNVQLERMASQLSRWRIVPSGTEGYRTAEVTLGGVDTRELSQRTLEALKVPGLFFIGESVDVTGHLGGHNFQWAWASGHAAGQVV